MRKLVFISTIFLIVVGNLYGQNNNGIGMNLGSSLLFGDSPIKDSHLMPKFEAYTFYQVSPKFTLKFQTGYSQIKSVTNSLTFKTAMIPLELIGSFSLMNSPTFPFIQAGIGLINIANRGAQTSFRA